MEFDINEISSLIKQEIKKYKASVDIAHVGKVLEVGDGIARIYGLDTAMAGEMLEFENGVIGEVFNLEEESVGAIIYGDYLKVRESSTVRSTGKVLTVPVGFELLGRVVNSLCEPLDGKGSIESKERRLVESPAPGIADRQPVNQPLMTGLKSIDSMIPIGRGQRELIIGDRKTGKTAIALDTIINQKDKDVICVYVAIGQKESTVAEVVHILQSFGAMDHTVVVSASASDSAAMQFVAPYAGTAIAEYFMDEHGKDTLCVYDDLSKHAIAYRELSLLLRRPPGREAFPGDIFYLHSRLLERSTNLRDDLGGSLTALPIIETLEGQVSAYIPTNIISITDGQIYLQRNLFLSGVRPAVDVGISVSRVGGDAQPEAMKKVAPKLRLDLATFREMQAFAQMGTELDPAAQAQLERGKRMVEILKQKQFSPLSASEQVISILAGSAGLIDEIDIKDVTHFVTEMIDWVKLEAAEYLEHIESGRAIDDEFIEELTEAVRAYMMIYKFSFGR
ncbi:MAG: F0F1 ATP synthase subunit alpha [Sedimentisphaerales bacterium]|nr:F0F1 ATP synthase subunit alpha [Sedimentisphaerales bacterium]